MGGDFRKKRAGCPNVPDVSKFNDDLEDRLFCLSIIRVYFSIIIHVDVSESMSSGLRNFYVTLCEVFLIQNNLHR